MPVEIREGDIVRVRGGSVEWRVVHVGRNCAVIKSGRSRMVVSVDELEVVR